MTADYFLLVSVWRSLPVARPTFLYLFYASIINRLLIFCRNGSVRKRKGNVGHDGSSFGFLFPVRVACDLSFVVADEKENPFLPLFLSSGPQRKRSTLSVRRKEREGRKGTRHEKPELILYVPPATVNLRQLFLS